LLPLVEEELVLREEVGAGANCLRCQERRRALQGEEERGVTQRVEQQLLLLEVMDEVLLAEPIETAGSRTRRPRRRPRRMLSDGVQLAIEEIIGS
jgi:hypothetical protein